MNASRRVRHIYPLPVFRPVRSFRGFKLKYGVGNLKNGCYNEAF